MFVISQILVIIADLCFVFSMLSKNKLKLTMFLLCSDILFSLHYLCLNALSGFLILCIDAAFLITAFFFQKYNKEKFLPLASIFSISLIIAAGLLTWAGPISLLPIFAIGVYIFVMMFKNLIIVKIGTTIRNILNIIYVLLIGSYIGAVLECVLLINSIIGTILTIKQYKNRNFAENEAIY